jgi:hypothetical protein
LPGEVDSDGCRAYIALRRRESPTSFLDLTS